MVSSTRPAPQAEADTPGAVPDVGGPAPGPRRTVPLSLGLLLVPAFIGLVRLVIGLHRPFAQSGDAAILETAVRRVATGTQALGPYSRFGFHQPGPAYFFVQAPFSWLTGGSSRSLFVGALVINFGAATASVAVVRRLLGEPAARWAALVVIAYLLAVTPALLTDPWNPYVLGMPLLLTILLAAAAAAAGSWSAAAGAAVVGSCVVQTHLGTGATLLAVLTVAAVIGAAGRRRRDGRASPPTAGIARRRASLAAAGVLLALFWVPPLVEEATHSPGNLAELARFFGHSHPEFDAGFDHSLDTASTQVAAQLVTVPFGRASTDDRPARDAAAAAGVLAAAGLGWAGWRRRNLLVAALGGMSVAASLAAVWSTTRIVGEALPYLLVWAGVLLLPAWIGLGLLLHRPPAPGRTESSHQARSGLAVVAVALGVTLAWSMLRAPLPPVPSDPDVPALAGLARPWLTEHGARQVRVHIGEHDRWPLAAGVINRLEKDGVDVTVDPEWTPILGDQFRPTGREPAEIWLTGPAATPPVSGRERLGALASASVWAGPLADKGQS